MPGSTLVVAATAPLHGEDAALGRDVVAGERLALEAAGGRAGRFHVRLAVRDSVEQGHLVWTPAQVADDARQAAKDPRTIAYLGDVEPAASAVSVVILNQRGIAQLSPTDSFGGLTREEGAEPGEPAKYYPRGNRTFARLVPDDDRQVAALVAWLRHTAIDRVAVLDDRALYGHALAGQVVLAAKHAGLALGTAESVDLHGADPARLRDVADRVAASRPDAVVVGATPSAPVARLFAALHRRLPAARLVAPAGLGTPAFVARLGPAAEATEVVAPAPDPGPGARAFAARFRRAYHRGPGPGAAQGYEAMRTALAAIRRAGSRGRRRAAVLRAIRATRRSASAIGPFALDAAGDVEPARMAVFDVRARRLHLVQPLR